MNELKNLSEALLKYETLDADDVKRVIDGKEPLLLSEGGSRIPITIIPPDNGGGKLPKITTPSPHPFKI